MPTEGQADQDTDWQRKSFWYLGIYWCPASLWPEQQRRSFCLISLPAHRTLNQNHLPTVGPSPKQLAHPHHWEMDTCLGPHQESEWAQVVLFQHLVCKSQPVELVFWQLWAAIMQISTLGVLKNIPKGKSYIFEFAYLHLHAISQNCCTLLDPMGVRGSAPPAMLIWISEHFLQMLFPSHRYTLHGIWNKYLQLSFWFFPLLLFPVTLCSPREEKH